MKAPDSEQLVSAFVAKARIELAQNDSVAGCDKCPSEFDAQSVG